MSKNQKTQSLKDFELIKVIGKGQFGKVLLVQEKKTSQIMALKIIKKKQITNQKEFDYIMNEKNILVNTNHPFIVKMFSSFKTEKKLIFVLEYCPGGEVFNLLLKYRCLQEDQALFYTAQVVLAINHLHQNDIIYRDLKPENVIIDQAGYIRLTDFGLSKFQVKDKSKSFSGTPEYLAPEILKNEGKHDKRADYWTIGCFLYELIEGNPPFQSNNFNDLFRTIKFSSVKFSSKFSKASQQLLLGLLEKEPEKRFTYRDIISSQFFSTIDLNLLEKKQITAKYKPNLNSQLDIQNFDSEFTQIPVNSFDDNLRIDENFNFSNFDYDTLN